MAKDSEELAFEQRGEDFVLCRTDAQGTAAEMILSELDVMYLARLAPQFARQICASKAPDDSDISILVPVRVCAVEMGSDVHQEYVAFRLEDQAGMQLDYSIDPTRAREFAHLLMTWADRVSNAPKPIRQ